MSLEFKKSEITDGEIIDVRKKGGKRVMHVEVYAADSRSPRTFAISWWTELSQRGALQKLQTPVGYYLTDTVQNLLKLFTMIHKIQVLKLLIRES